MTDVLIKWGNWDTERDTHTRRPPCEHKSRGWGDASISQGPPKIASKSVKPGRQA